MSFRTMKAQEQKKWSDYLRREKREHPVYILATTSNEQTRLNQSRDFNKLIDRAVWYFGHTFLVSLSLSFSLSLSLSLVVQRSESLEHVKGLQIEFQQRNTLADCRHGQGSTRERKEIETPSFRRFYSGSCFFYAASIRGVPIAATGDDLIVRNARSKTMVETKAKRRNPNKRRGRRNRKTVYFYADFSRFTLRETAAPTSRRVAKTWVDERLTRPCKLAIYRVMIS